MADDVSKLTKLGSQRTEYADRGPHAGMLEVFDNPRPGRTYTITHHTDEFTSLCPKTEQPDFGSVLITYVPGATCIESKSLKLYLFAFRNEGAFMESITNKILDDLVAASPPVQMTVSIVFKARGGVQTSVSSSFPE